MNLGLVYLFVLRMMEFKGWVTHVSQSSIQVITDDDVSTVVKDLEKMVPQKAHKWIVWDQTRKEQETWPMKMMERMCFKNETILVTMILVRMRAHVPVIFSLQETRSWGLSNLEFLGYVCCGSKFGLVTLLVSDQFCNITRS